MSFLFSFFIATMTYSEEVGDKPWGWDKDDDDEQYNNEEEDDSSDDEMPVHVGSFPFFQTLD